MWPISSLSVQKKTILEPNISNIKCMWEWAEKTISVYYPNILCLCQYRNKFVSGQLVNEFGFSRRELLYRYFVDQYLISSIIIQRIFCRLQLIWEKKWSTVHTVSLGVPLIFHKHDTLCTTGCLCTQVLVHKLKNRYRA